MSQLVGSGFAVPDAGAEVGAEEETDEDEEADADDASAAADASAAGGCLTRCTRIRSLHASHWTVITGGSSGLSCFASFASTGINTCFLQRGQRTLGLSAMV